MNWNAARFYLEVAVLGLTLAGWVYSLMSNRSKAKKEEFESFATGVGERLDRQDGRITTQSERVLRLEGKVDALPDHDDMEKFHGRISGVKADVQKLAESMGHVASDVSAIGATVSAMAKTVDLLNQHHLRERDR